MDDQLQVDASVIEGLAVALKQAAEAMKNIDKSKFYLVVASVTGRPSIFEFDSVDQCKAKLAELHQEKKDYPLFVYLFEGRKWSVRNSPLSLVSPDGQFYLIRPESITEEQVDVI